jgi:hypothetical protein
VAISSLVVAVPNPYEHVTLPFAEHRKQVAGRADAHGLDGVASSSKMVRMTTHRGSYLDRDRSVSPHSSRVRVKSDRRGWQVHSAL